MNFAYFFAVVAHARLVEEAISAMEKHNPNGFSSGAAWLLRLIWREM